MSAQNPSASSEFLEALTKLSRKIRTLFNARVTAHGLTYPRARVLIRLARKSGCTQRELACELELEQPTLVRILDRMEALDLITREPDPADRRAKHIVLTAHGREQASLVQRLGEEMRCEVFSKVEDAELRRAVDLFERIEAEICVVAAAASPAQVEKPIVGKIDGR
ncbi:MarR family transcriptional regulator for hemolysin [Breoghania corrubedonensis]|uniref:MarR family transcriptional regulator for hemolysin n=1 Tax=Breoghania corrubedonensis TaxID=665038 RepID=A0A2T5V6L6_9HYPH|nr:MarR family winged helix-turn-helix transcriptional regulator [Breoghania corrubedonensis]PTW59389.1 MarR family transcriptional regulator for hemolysin [Breoghania corrubedonensis]